MPALMEQALSTRQQPRVPRGATGAPPLQLDTAMTCCTSARPPARPSSAPSGLAGCAVMARSTCAQQQSVCCPACGVKHLMPLPKVTTKAVASDINYTR